MPSPLGGLREMWAGLRLPFRALRLIRSSPRLRRLCLLSALLTLAILVLVTWLLVSYLGAGLTAIWPRPTGTAGGALWVLVRTLAFVFLWAVLALSLPPLALAPLQDTLSDETEVALGRRCVSHTPVGPFAALGRTAGRVALLWAGQGLLLLFFLIPGGAGPWTVFSTAWAMTWASAEYLDAPMARHGYDAGELRRTLRDRTSRCIGLGTGLYVLLYIPVLNLFLTPVAVVAGTLLYCDISGTPS